MPMEQFLVLSASITLEVSYCKTPIQASTSTPDSLILYVLTDRLGYNEKFYFTPSEEPFQVWNTVCP
jgi:hypothetical protein